MVSNARRMIGGVYPKFWAKQPVGGKKRQFSIDNRLYRRSRDS